MVVTSTGKAVVTSTGRAICAVMAAATAIVTPAWAVPLAEGGSPMANAMENDHLACFLATECGGGSLAGAASLRLAAPEEIQADVNNSVESRALLMMGVSAIAKAPTQASPLIRLPMTPSENQGPSKKQKIVEKSPEQLRNEEKKRQLERIKRDALAKKERLIEQKRKEAEDEATKKAKELAARARQLWESKREDSAKKECLNEHSVQEAEDRKKQAEPAQQAKEIPSREEKLREKS